MKNLMKKSLAVFLVILMLSGSFSAFAAVELNKDAVAAHYDQYKNYVLLGDSVASGYRDIITDKDQQYNVENYESSFHRIEGSYGDIIADSIIADGSYTPMAGPGFRTIEIRYMLEDDYAANLTDEYLFYCSNIKTKGDPSSEEWRTKYKNAVASADLITLGVGGNDWGAYLTWVITETLLQAGIFDELVAKIKGITVDGNLNLETVGDILEIVATNSDAFATLISSLPSALEYGLSTFYANWDIMIEDIYAYNPDVTLMVVGMSDNGLKGKYYDYDGVEGAPVTSSTIAASEGVMKYIVEFIMTVGNAPMIEGAKKYGYTYVDTEGTTYVESHPDADGHAHIANKIIEALPDREISTKYADVKPGHKYFASIEYVLKNNIMSATSETTFSPDENLTSGQLNEALNALLGTSSSTSSTKEATIIQLGTGLVSVGAKRGITNFFKAFSLLFKLLSSNKYNVAAKITRAEAAYYIASVCGL